MPPASLLQSLAREGHVFVPAGEALAWLSPHGDWAELTASYDDLVVDEYMADGGRYRRRRHAVYRAERGEITRAPHRPHYQSLEYNPLNGGIARLYAPIEEAIGAGETLRSVLREGLVCAEGTGAASPRSWDIEVHQFRIEAGVGGEGLPTPEGVHRDGVDWVLVLLLRRVNIERGTTTIFSPSGELLGSFTLTEPGDVVALDDHRVYHGVTPVTPLDPELPAFRDVLVVTYRADRSSGALASSV